MLKQIRKHHKRLVAFLVSAAMVITNVGGNAGIAFASDIREEREVALFMADGQEILEAIQGLKDQDPFSQEDLEELELDSKKKGLIKKYEKLLKPEEGKVYELDLDIDSQLALEGTSLRVFYHTKEKEVIFLFLNESGQAVDCCVNIDGYETKLVTVEANDANATEETQGEEESSGEETESNSQAGASGGTSGGSGGSAGSGSGQTPEGTSGQAPDSGNKTDKETTEDGAGQDESKEEPSKEEVRPEEDPDHKEEQGEEVSDPEDSEKEEDKETEGEDSKPDKEENKDSDKETDSADAPVSKDPETGKTEGSGQETDEKPSHKEEPDESKEHNSDKEENNKEENDNKVNSDKDKEETGSDTSKEDDGDKKPENPKEDHVSKPEEKPEKEEGSDSSKDDSSKEEAAENSEAKTEKENGISGTDDKTSETKEKDSQPSEEKSTDSKDDGMSEDKKSENSRPDNSRSGNHGIGTTLSLSNHKAAMVTVSLDSLEEENVKEEETEELFEETKEETEPETVKETEEPETKEEKETETETKKETEPETAKEAEETETEAETEKETAAEETIAKDETEDQTETIEESDATESGKEDQTDKETGEVKPEESTEETKEENPETTTEAVEMTEEIKETEKPEETSSEENQEDLPEETTEKETEEDGGSSAGGSSNLGNENQEIGDDWEIPGTVYDTITIQETINARAYCVALEDIHKIVDGNDENETLETVSGRFDVDYRINLEDAAQIKGPDSVEDGESLYFAVEPEDGYDISAVLANGSWLDAVENPGDIDDENTNWSGYSYVYQVEAVTEDLEILVELEESLPIIPSQIYTGETSDAVITVNVPEEAFTEEVELQVAKIEDQQQLDELAAQANSALKEEQAVAGIMAYDISFISKDSGQEIEPAKAVAVSIQLKSADLPKEAADKEITEISVVHLPENEAAEVVATVENVSETKIEFQAESFSVFVVTYAATVAAATEDNSFFTLQDALDKVEDGGTLYLLRNVSENVKSEGKSYTLDMRGKTLSSKEEGKVVFAISGGEVKIQNGTITGGDYNRSYSSKFDGKGIKATNADLTLENCVVSKNNGSSMGSVHGGGISATGGSLTIIGCDIIENTAINRAAGIYALNCPVTIDGNSRISDNVTSNDADKYAGGIYIEGADLTIRNSEICDNQIGNAGTNNASALVAQNGVVTIENTVLSGNRVQIENTKNAEHTTTLNSVTLKQTDGSYGFNINSIGNVLITNCKFNDNGTISTGYSDKKLKGSVLYLAGSGEKTISNCEFKNNTGITSNLYAYGPLNVMEGTVKLEGCTFSGNTGFQAGAIYQSSKSTSNLELKGVTIAGNKGREAGGIYAGQGTIKVVDTVIKNNTAAGVGNLKAKAGGIYADNKTNFTMESGAIYNNKCQDTTAHDVGMNYNTTVTILPASEMSDEDFDFTGYVWNNMSASIEGTLTTSSNANRSWSATKADAAAQIGDTVYDTLAQALTDAKNGDTITLISSYLPSGDMFTVDKKITIDMNGGTIFASTKSSKGSQGVSSSKVIRGGIFKIVSGGELTLTGTGTISNHVIMAGGTLNIDGNVVINPEGIYNIGSNTGIMGAATSSKEPHGGTVNILANVDKVTVGMTEGTVVLHENGYVEELQMSVKIAYPYTQTMSGIINGKVGTLLVSQTGASKNNDNSFVELNGEIDSLMLYHYAPSPITRAGKNFQVNKLVLKPFWSSSNPTMEEQANPEMPVKDILMIRGMGDDGIQASQVNWGNTGWLNPSSPNTDPAQNRLTYNGKDYSFLTTVALDEKGNIVLRKTLPQGNYVFLSGTGNDTADGLSLQTPVKTFQKATELLEQNNLNTIYVTGEVTVSTAKEPVWSLKEGQSIKRYPTYKGALVKVTSAGKLTLKDIVMDGTSDGSYGSAEYPMIMNSGTLNIEQGAVLQNNQNGYQDVGREGGAIRNDGTLNMNGGEIKNNSAVSGGGIFNSKTFNMNNGTITGNKGTGKHKSSGTIIVSTGKRMDVHNAGGGVFIAKSGIMTMKGGTISENTAYMGGGIALGNDHNVYIGGTFNMEGGTITRNESEKEGGGIFVQENGIARINAGDITYNQSHGGTFGGGGVYVNGGTGTGNRNGKLYLKNVKVSENTAAGDGGGIAACPSASVEIYLDDGGLIKGNTGNGTDFDIFVTSTGYNKYTPTSTRKVYISRYMLGGGLYEWTDVEGKASGTTSVYSAAKNITAKDEMLSVRITNNTSDTKGGGIGTNGDVIIGTGNGDTVDITVKKNWKLSEDGGILSGEELKGSGINDAVKSVTFELWGRLEGQEEWEHIKPDGVSRPQMDGTWSEITFKNLINTDESGKTWEYKVVEKQDDKFVGEEINNGDGTWTVTNIPVYSLKLTKKVIDDYQKYPEGKTFEFEITLKDKEGTPYNRPITAVDQNGAESTINFQDGTAKLNLGKDDFLLLKGLTSGSTYQITEAAEEEYETEIRVNGKVEEMAAGTIQIGSNEVVYTNTTKEPQGSIKISKLVEHGSIERDWNFVVEFKDSEGNPLNTKGKLYSFTYYEGDEITLSTEEAIMAAVGNNGTAAVEKEFTLKHNQSLEIGGLPAGTLYTVKEKEANTNNYVTVVEGSAQITSEGGSGVIEEKTASQVTFTNKLNIGSLVISKKVSVPDDNMTERIKNDSFTFYVELTKPAGIDGDLRNLVHTFGIMDGFDQIVAPDQDGFEITQPGKDQLNLTVVLKHGQMITLSELPAGTTYTVTEADAKENGYSTPENHFTGTIVDKEAAAAAFTNVVNVGKLLISKQVSGSNLTDADKEKEFTFEVEFMDLDGSILTGSYPYTSSDDEKKGTIANGDTITLKDGEWILIENLPEKTRYTVWEKRTNTEGYTPSVDGSDSVEGTGDKLIGGSGIFENDTVSAVHFTNTVDTGKLSVEKIVEGLELDQRKVFTFEVKLTGKNQAPLAGTYPYSITTEGTDALETGTLVLDAQGKGTIELTHGQTAVVSEIPVDTVYEVTETNVEQNHYQVNGQNNKGTIGQKDQEVKVRFTNTVKEGSLEIKKTVSGIQPENGRKFPFTLKVENTAVDGKYGDVTFVSGIAEFELAADEMVRVNGLPDGVHYTVEEGSHDGYTSISPENASGIIAGETVITVSFVNVKEEGKLSIQKTVTGAAGDRNKDFVFLVKLTGKDGTLLSGSYPYTGSATEDGAIAPPSGILTLNDRGEGRITLKHGQQITINGLPAGANYQVTEVLANQDGYVTTINGGNGRIEKDGEATAKFVNHKPEEENPDEPNNPTDPEKPTSPTDPEEPTSPTDPTQPTTPPDRPTNPNRPTGGGGGGRDRDPEPDTTPIPPEDVPLTTIDPDQIPLAMMPEETPDVLLIDDEGVPLFGLPRTGDRNVPAGALLGMMVLSLMAACGIHVKKRKEEE